MKLVKIKNITKEIKQTYDLSIHNNHNFFANNHLIHNSDYRGEVIVMLKNHGSESFNIEEGMKIAQLVVTPVVTPIILEVDELDETKRGSKGFGSSGTF